MAMVIGVSVVSVAYITTREHGNIAVAHPGSTVELVLMMGLWVSGRCSRADTATPLPLGGRGTEMMFPPLAAPWLPAAVGKAAYWVMSAAELSLPPHWL